MPGWCANQQQLARTFHFEQFQAGILFVDSVAGLAEHVAHHPNIDIRFTKITIRLSTHGDHGITENDFALAAEITSLFAH